MSITDRKLRVFLCHASQDKPVVRELYAKLLAEGWIDPWLDEKRLLPGQDWGFEIEKSVESSDVVIVCLSNNSVTKEGYVQRELRYVLDIALEKPEGKIFIVPVRFDNCQPPRRLRSWQYVDYFPVTQKEFAYQQILSSLKLRKTSLADSASSSIKSLIHTATPVNKPLASNTVSTSPKLPSTRKFTPSGFEVYTYGGLEFVKVTKGKFLMGAPDDGISYFDSRPQHECEIPYDYWIGRFTVTNKEFELFAVASERTLMYQEGNERHPVVNVSMLDVRSFIRWMNATSGVSLPLGYTYNLPSEAEWEKAARGTDGRLYPWGNTFHSKRCNVKESGIGKPTLVGLYSPDGDSPYGCADMSGNVAEFTRTIWDYKYKYPYNPKDGRESGTIDDTVKYVMRGGGFFWESNSARCSWRSSQSSRSAHFFGFRLVIIPR
jgi:formylglycine-generating enzyme required for sulfatase activity